MDQDFEYRFGLSISFLNGTVHIGTELILGTVSNLSLLLLCCITILVKNEYKIFTHVRHTRI